MKLQKEIHHTGGGCWVHHFHGEKGPMVSVSDELAMIVKFEGKWLTYDDYENDYEAWDEHWSEPETEDMHFIWDLFESPGNIDSQTLLDNGWSENEVVQLRDVIARIRDNDYKWESY